ncbi:MAG: class I SAM-dependent methyltransferase [candidate division WOR-3 bacterium]|nr:MAG: class I SAM-dependent methyltransferase [candidate division WOR-3 bacterium]
MKSNSCSTPFATIAPFYDKLMSFVNYPSWVAYIEKIIQMSSVKDKSILDLACGTGVCLELWSKNGYRVIGLDRSLPMLEVCREKIAAHDGALLINGDIRNFKLGFEMPIITCLYDSLNYLLTEGELLSCFRRVHDALRSDGLFIFDMNTIHSLRDEWGNNSFQRRDEGLFSVWTNKYDSMQNISSLNITLHVRRNGQEIVLKEFHQERGYELSVIGELLNDAGFNFSLYRHLTFTPATELDLRIMGVARK